MCIRDKLWFVRVGCGVIQVTVELCPADAFVRAWCSYSWDSTEGWQDAEKREKKKRGTSEVGGSQIDGSVSDRQRVGGESSRETAVVLTTARSGRPRVPKCRSACRKYQFYASTFFEVGLVD